MSNANLYIFLLGLGLLIVVVNMVRTRRLQERYALLWLLAAVGLMIAPLFIPVLDEVAYAMGFAYTPALLLMLAVVGLLLLIFQLSLSLTRTGEQLKVVTQELGLLRHELDTLMRKPTSDSFSTPTEASMKSLPNEEMLEHDSEPG